MPEFLRLLPPDEAKSTFLDAISTASQPLIDVVPTEEALGRILATPITAGDPLPPFARSTVDGYAVRAEDTFGASQSLPSYLTLAGEIHMGTQAELLIEPTQAVLIHTGGMIPDGANAVVMIEDTQKFGEDQIEVLKPVAQGENVLQKGEDVKKGEIVLDAGTKLRPQEIGGLMALGITEVQVVRRPHVGIISTGDEVIPPWEEQRLGQIRDVNSYTLSALVTRLGGTPVVRGIVPDQYDDLLTIAKKAHAEDDVIVITAGSSVSTHDRTVDVVGALGQPGVLVHGITIRPGKPTILAVADGVPIIGLPGNPVSALVIAGLFLTPVISKLLGMEGKILSPQIPAVLSVNIASETGREDYVPVSITKVEGGFSAEPIFGRSNLIFTLVRADGLIRIPPESTGLSKGTEVEVLLF